MNGILKNRFYLYMTEFIAGISVMAVELGASRLLAPYFSSSQIAIFNSKLMISSRFSDLVVVLTSMNVTSLLNVL